MESLHSLWECEGDLSDLDDADHEALEDGEISPASHNLPTVSPSSAGGLSFQFAANELDAAVQRSKKLKRIKKAGKRKGKRSKKSEKKRAHDETNPSVFIGRTCRFLKEPKHYLVGAAVERLGIDVVRDLVHEVETIEKNGGQLISSGKRRRTPGGVLWNVLRSRYEDDYKAIMVAGRNYEKEQRQQKRKMDVNDMAIDEQPSTKRRKTQADGSGVAPLKAAQVKRTGVTVWPSRCTHMDDIQCKVDPDDKLTVSRVQNAWAESLKRGKHINQKTEKGKLDGGHTDVEMLDEGRNKKPSIADRLRIPIQYDDL